MDENFTELLAALSQLRAAGPFSSLSLYHVGGTPDAVEVALSVEMPPKEAPSTHPLSESRELPDWTDRLSHPLAPKPAVAIARRVRKHDLGLWLHVREATVGLLRLGMPDAPIALQLPTEVIHHIAGLLDEQWRMLARTVTSLPDIALCEAGQLRYRCPAAESLVDLLAQIDKVLPRLKALPTSGQLAFGPVRISKKILSGSEPIHLLRFSPTPRAESKPIFALSKREREVGLMAAKGLKPAEISERLECSYNTVRSHLRRIYSTLDISSRVELGEHFKIIA